MCHLQSEVFASPIETDFYVSPLPRLLVSLLQLSVKAGLAHSAGFASVAFREVTTAGGTIEQSAG
jgi:hypothetical protein